jgi:hypothetical protein
MRTDGRMDRHDEANIHFSQICERAWKHSYFLILLHVSAHVGHPQVEPIYKGKCLFCQKCAQTNLIHSTMWKWEKIKSLHSNYENLALTSNT